MKKDYVILRKPMQRKGRKYCQKHGEDITILSCQFCGEEIGKEFKKLFDTQ